MNYTEFTCAVEKMINQKMTGGVRAELHTAVKNNGIKRTGVLIEAPGINISPTIYLEEYYDDYMKGKPLERITEDVIAFYGTVRQEKSWDCEKIMSGLWDFRLRVVPKTKSQISTYLKGV